MKIRTDFVTNSSSSSYVCDVCGRNEVGRDITLSEIEMVECENGHLFCEDEMLESPTLMDYKEYLVSYFSEDKDAFRDIEENPDSNYESLAYEYELSYMMPEKFCPICSFVEYQTVPQHKSQANT